MAKKIIQIKDYQKKKEKKMIFLIVIFSIIAAILVWNRYVEQAALLDVEIPQSSEIFYNNQTPIPVTALDVGAEFDESEGKPILLYIYTTWCGVCKKNFPMINEIAREFQNTDLKFVALAIDRDLNPQILSDHLNSLGHFYFQPLYLMRKDGFVDFLKSKSIRYRGTIPFVALIGRDGKVKISFSGAKRSSSLRSKVIRELF